MIARRRLITACSSYRTKETYPTQLNKMDTPTSTSLKAQDGHRLTSTVQHAEAHRQFAMIVPRMQRKRSYDELAWSRYENVQATSRTGYDSDGSGTTIPFSQPPSKRCETGSRRLTSVPVHAQVFLGGACGSKTWRRDVAIPALIESGTTYYNPQLEEGAWHSGLIAVEAEAKERADVVMFVVDGQTS